jgi:excisionase family DNA binding protein
MSKILLTPTEAAEITGISVNTIQRWCNNDPNFPSFKVGTYNKIGRAALEEWISQQCKDKSTLC